MIRYRVIIPLELQSHLAHLPPAVKQKVHASLRLLETNPWAGKPLGQELTGYRSHPIHPYRIIYRIETQERLVRLVRVAPRREVYDLLAHQLIVRDRSRRRKKASYRISETASLLR